MSGRNLQSVCTSTWNKILAIELWMSARTTCTVHDIVNRNAMQTNGAMQHAHTPEGARKLAFVFAHVIRNNKRSDAEFATLRAFW